MGRGHPWEAAVGKEGEPINQIILNVEMTTFHPLNMEQANNVP